MSKSIRVYHKPTCITYKITIDKLNSHGLKFGLYDFFKEKLTKKYIKLLLKMSSLSIIDILRNNDETYSELKFGEKKYTENGLIEITVKYTRLLLRPIIVRMIGSLLVIKQMLLMNFKKN